MESPSGRKGNQSTEGSAATRQMNCPWGRRRTSTAGVDEAAASCQGTRASLYLFGVRCVTVLDVFCLFTAHHRARRSPFSKSRTDSIVVECTLTSLVLGVHSGPGLVPPEQWYIPKRSELLSPRISSSWGHSCHPRNRAICGFSANDHLLLSGRSNRGAPNGERAERSFPTQSFPRG